MEKFEIIFIDSNEFDMKDIVSKDTPNFSDLNDLLKMKTNYVDFDKSLIKLKIYVIVKKLLKKHLWKKL